MKFIIIQSTRLSKKNSQRERESAKDALSHNLNMGANKQYNSYIRNNAWCVVRSFAYLFVCLCVCVRYLLPYNGITKSV